MVGLDRRLVACAFALRSMTTTRGLREMPINNNWIKIGALVAALAVVLGGLDWHQYAAASSGQCSTEQAAGQVAAINKAVYFQFIHALAIILAGVLGVLRPSRMLSVTAFFFLLGIILFSGSTYLSVFVNYYWLEYVRLAGVFTLVGTWILLVEAGCPGWNKNIAPLIQRSNSLRPSSGNPTRERGTRENPR